jgi:hypothetical protein
VAILVPNAKVAARWHGALESRLRQAPLEAFLRSRGQPCALSGETRITDNIAAATMYFVQRARGTRTDGAAGVGPLVCAVCDGLAALVREPNAWRVAALISTARALAPAMGLGPAADISASAVRDYSMSLGGEPIDPRLPHIRAAVAGAVQGNDERLVTLALRPMTELLFAAPLAEAAHVAV